LGVLERLHEHSRAIGGVDAIAGDGGVVRYRELYEQVLAAIDFLSAGGIDDAAVVGLAIEDEAQHLIAALALLGIGAHHVTLASHDTVSFKHSLVQRLKLTHVVDAGMDEQFPGLAHVKWPALEGAIGMAMSPSKREGVVYFNTSGTTGEVKIVPLADRQLAAQARHHPDYAGERLLRLGSIEHNISKRLRLYCAYDGGTNVFVPKGGFDLVEFCGRQRVSELDVSRMHASDLAALGTTAFRDVTVSVAGSPVPFDVRRRVETDVTPLLTVRYGATECGTIAFAGPGQHDELEAVGLPVAGLELEIVDGLDVAVGTLKAGNIRVRVAGMATGYLGNPAETRQRFRDGWFYPGDVGTLLEDGRLVVHGRADDMMILNSINVFPAEIERILERHPAVLTSAALPLASRVHGQIPVAAVELRPGAVVTSRELLDYAREQLALRAPRRIIVLEALPRNEQGKILRRELVSMFEFGKPGA
jgi:acyl-coenzyme A synthetase/AMP-(fatty) acid ligase